MANVNFCGLEVLDQALPATGENLGEYIDTINSYMGEPVVSEYWKNGSETIANGDTIDTEAAQYDWENYQPKQATTTNIQEVIYHNAIDPDCFGDSIIDGQVTEQNPHVGDPNAEEHVSLKITWRLATAEEIEAAKAANKIVNVFKQEKLYHLKPEEGSVVAFCKSGLYTFLVANTESTSTASTLSVDDIDTITTD